MLGAVPGGVDDPHADGSDPQHVVVLDGRRAGTPAAASRWIETGIDVLEREPSVRRDVVRVGVRLEHPDDADPRFAPRRRGSGSIVEGRVDDERLSRLGIADQIGAASEVVVDELPKDEHGTTLTPDTADVRSSSDPVSVWERPGTERRTTPTATTKGPDCMTRTRLWTGLAVLGTAALVTAGCGGGGSSKSAESVETGGATGAKPSGGIKQGGTARFNLATDTDYVDPALAYYQISWQMEYATCAKLLNYPDKSGGGGLAAPARGRREPAEGLGRWNDVHVHRAVGLQVLAALEPAGDGGDLQVRDQPRPQPEDELAGGAVHHRHRRRAGRARQEGDRGIRRHGQRQQADDQADEEGAGLPLADRDAVLLRGPDEHAGRPRTASRRSRPPVRTTSRRGRRSGRSS